MKWFKQVNYKMIRIPGWYVTYKNVLYGLTKDKKALRKTYALQWMTKMCEENTKGFDIIFKDFVDFDIYYNTDAIHRKQSK